MYNKKLLYKIDRLPVIMPYHFRASNELHKGDLVYYGPSPEFYGIGEITHIVDNLCVVYFHGTGELGLHKDALEKKYLIPIHKLNLSHLIKER